MPRSRSGFRRLAFQPLEPRRLLSAASMFDTAEFLSLDALESSENTGEKPQSKVWQYGDHWWSVLPDDSGTWLWRLDDTSWTSVLKLTSNSGVHADVKAAGDLAHVLLYDGKSSEFITVEHTAGTPETYRPWSLQPNVVDVSLSSGVETASIDVDSTGRIWLASDAGHTVEVRYSDSPYTSFSGPITVASGISSDDISAVAALPDGRIGVLWSDQDSERFGFRTHQDGDDPQAWSPDEVPASQSARSTGGGMADDHLNLAVASDGTLYAAVKTSYDSSGYAKIGLLVRRPSGDWDPMYTVDTRGTRPIVVINEEAGRLIVAYTRSESGGDILYRESPLDEISFGSTGTLIRGDVNNVSSTKQVFTDELVVIAEGGGDVEGTRILLAPSDPDPDPPPAPKPEPASTIGLYDPLGRFHIKNSLSSGMPDQSFYWGPGTDAGWQALAGDWDGDGADTIGLYDPQGQFHVKNSLGSGLPDETFSLGLGPDDGWQAIAGDWDGDGLDTIGLYDPLGRFHVKNSLSSGDPDQSFYWGPGTAAGWRAIAGDWNGDGTDTIGLYDTQGRVHVKNTLGGGLPDQSFYWGLGTGQGWQALAGDWDADGDDTIGLYDPLGRFHVKNSLGGGMPDQSFYWGPGTSQNWQPLAGDWDGTGGSPLRAAGPAVDAELQPAMLTGADVQTVLGEAVADWKNNPSLDPTNALDDVTVVVTHLGGDLLGQTVGSTIYLDADAAGHGWFVDPTPGESKEFAPDSSGILRAIDPAAVDKIDLLTVVRHELGHVLGLEDVDGSGDGPMHGVLATGVRRHEAAVDLLFQVA